MTEFGFPPTPAGDWSIPEEQWQTFGVAEYSCLVMYPYAEIYTYKSGEAEHRRYYEDWRDIVLPCLKEKGYATKELPSFEIFTANAGSENEYYPVGEDFHDLGSTRFEEAAEACHVLSSADYIRGLTDTP